MKVTEMREGREIGGAVESKRPKGPLPSVGRE